MTKKQFKAIAEIINTQSGCERTFEYDDDYDRGWGEATQRLGERLADYLATQNPLFNREKFLKACGL